MAEASRCLECDEPIEDGGGVPCVLKCFDCEAEHRGVYCDLCWDELEEARLRALFDSSDLSKRATAFLALFPKLKRRQG